LASLYWEEIRTGKRTHPLTKQTDVSIVDLWNDALVEAMGYLVKYSAPNPMVFAETREQVDTMTEILRQYRCGDHKRKAMPNPAAGVWPVYDFLRQTALQCKLPSLRIRIRAVRSKETDALPEIRAQSASGAGGQDPAVSATRSHAPPSPFGGAAKPCFAAGESGVSMSRTAALLRRSTLVATQRPNGKFAGIGVGGILVIIGLILLFTGR